MLDSRSREIEYRNSLDEDMRRMFDQLTPEDRAAVVMFVENERAPLGQDECLACGEWVHVDDQTSHLAEHASWSI